MDNQTTDRAYRIGQTNRVMVHKFITSGSVEERIDRLDPGQLHDLVALED